MKSLLLSILLFLPTTAFAQTVMPNGCQEVNWIANTEPDLEGYRLYITENGVSGMPIDIDKADTSIPCSMLPVAEGALYAFALTAFDTSGNESVPGASVLVNWPDGTPPNAPVGTCVKYTDIAGELQCAVAP